MRRVSEIFDAFGVKLLDATLTLLVDISVISSVVGNISGPTPSPTSSTSTLRLEHSKPQPQPQRRIVINGIAPREPNSNPQTHRKTSSTSSQRNKEIPLLSLHPADETLASEWLDGLLMLLGQSPITAETQKLLKLVSSWGLKIRLLNVKYEDNGEPQREAPPVPSREGLDEDYYYDLGGM